MKEKMTKTYAVHGLMDWQAQLKVGKATVSIPFTGGTLTGYGFTPALFTTSNPLFMAIIENSHYFKQGRITLYRVVSSERGERKEERGERNASSSEGNVGAVGVEGSEGTDGSGSGKDAIVVTCLDDARQYLISECGVDWSKLTNKTAILKAAKEAGVTFKGL